MSWFGRNILLIIVSLLILESKKCSCIRNFNHEEWWEKTLVYEIWPSSFQDSDGNGIGDLQGIINRLDYLDDLEIETICLNPIFESPVSDAGFDVSDYENINKILGNLTDFDELVKEVHARDMKLILDVVPNHTSDKHKWFEASKNMIDPFKDYYVWANGTLTPDGIPIPPSNQFETMGEDDIKNSAWTYNLQRRQWYYHTFGPFQPDLNLENADVRRDVMGIFNFWLKREVDGFRITGVPYFFEDFHLGKDQLADRKKNVSTESKNVQFLYDIREYVDEWTELNNANSKYLITSSYDTQEHLLSYYVDKKNDTVSVLPPNYCLLKSNVVAGSNASQLGNVIEQWLNAIPMNESTNWMLSNRDNLRITSRVGPDRLDALLMLSMLLPGQTHTFYGDEIGLLDIPVPMNDEIHSTRAFNESRNYQYYSPISPMQWDNSLLAGFSNATHHYVPVHDNYMYVNVAEQLNDPHSHLNVFKKLAKLKYDLVIRNGDWEIESINDDAIFVLRRMLTDHPIYVVVINLSNKEKIVNMTNLYPDLNEYLDVVVTSGNNMLREVVSRNHFPIAPNAGIVLRSEPNETRYSTIIDEEERLETEEIEFEKTDKVKVEEEEKGNAEAAGKESVKEEKRGNVEAAEKEDAEEERKENSKVEVKEYEMIEKNKNIGEKATVEKKVMIEGKETNKLLKDLNGEDDEKVSTKIPVEISIENNGDIQKQRHENVRTEAISKIETRPQRPSTTYTVGETALVSAGKNSAIANWNLITVIIITNYIIFKIC